MRKIRIILYAIIIAATTAFSAQAQKSVIIKAKLDSALLLMGKKTAIHIDITQDKDVKGYFTNEKSDTLTSMVEVSARPKADTTDIGNNRIQIKRDIIIQSFDSGMYVIPAFKYVVGKDTFMTNSLTLKVLPVKVNTLKTIHDYKPVEDPPFHFFDFLPSFITDYWWIYLIVLILIAGGIYTYIKWFRKGIVPLMPKKKELPPYEEAMIQLEQLKSQQLWQAGQEKEYYTRLTDILRNYIDRRFLISAMDMTSSQIIEILKKHEETKAVNEQLSQILEVADFVKFAQVRPLPDDNEASFQRAINFVKETKPEEIAASNKLTAAPGVKPTTIIKKEDKK